MPKTIVQIVGQPGSGKSEASAYLRDTLGFSHVRVSDMIRAYAQPRGIVLQERKDFLSAHANMLQELGKLCVVAAILDNPADLVVVDGIRVPAHIQPLRQHGPVIALDCPQNIRFERTLLRQGPLDKARLEDFTAEEAWEARQTDPYIQNTQTAIQMADYHIDSSRPFAVEVQDITAIVAPLISA